MSQRGNGSRRAHSGIWPVAPVLRAALTTGAACLFTVHSLAAFAQYRPAPVRFWAAGHIIPLSTTAEWDGQDTFVPITALPAIGARGSFAYSRDGVTVRLQNGRSGILRYYRRNGVVMIRLRELASFANASALPPRPGPPPGLLPNTAYLLAHVTACRIERGEIRISTSFPVPFVSNNLGIGGTRGYVDCVGATFTSAFRPALIPAAENRADRIRVGHFSPAITRVVVEMAPGYGLERINTEGRVTPVFSAALIGFRDRVATNQPLHRRPRRNPADLPPTDSGYPADLPPTHSPRTQPPRSPAGDQPTIPGDNGDIPPSDGGRRPPPSGPAPRGIADIRSISFESQNSESAQLIITTSRRLKAYVRPLAASRRLQIDIPNSRLNLDDDRQKDQSVQHPLVEGFSAATVQTSPRIPPLTRIMVDVPTTVTTSTESGNNQLIVDIAVARTSRLNRAPAMGRTGLVVVDPGHGGVLTGARGGKRGHGVYEKDITLAIATKLRATLESRGSRVIMTRTRDRNVPLEDRPRLANELGAKLFISLHNDSWGKANAITGVTTYYHANSAESRKLARCIQRELAAVSGLRDRGAMSDTTMYPSGFCVLRDSNMPAVLCELGYLNNAKDRSKLLDSAWQRRMAEAVCNGIRDYVAASQSAARHHTRRQIASA